MNRKRRRIQWALAPIVILVVALGWKFPVLGFAVPLTMLTGLVVSFFNGRYVCGNLCPRGAFLDRMVPHISPGKPIPAAFRNNLFRIVVVVGLMGFMIYRLSLNPASWEHWGRVFWLMCAVTTAVALILAALFNSRTWCAFCPMGTMQSWIGGRRNRLRVLTDTCRSCGKCVKVCPFGLSPMADKDKGMLQSADCLRCSECVSACPFDALKWPP
jgi:ferredoxin-type protein NapH